MADNETYHQLRMVWPEAYLDSPPVVIMPGGYTLRTSQPGDEAQFFHVMELAGWPGWDGDRLRPWLPRILPEGWFMAVHDETGRIVATAMALSDMSEFGTVGGELGWVASDLAHAGRGLGAAVSAAATRRLLQEGYRHIHLYTEHYRLPALKVYLKLGFVPYLYLPEMDDRWRAICEQLQWPFTPERWM